MRPPLPAPNAPSPLLDDAKPWPKHEDVEEAAVDDTNNSPPNNRRVVVNGIEKESPPPRLYFVEMGEETADDNC